MTSLVECIKQLEDDLAARPMRIAAHHDMPYAIFCYRPADEFPLRKQLRLLAITLEQSHARRVTFISMARIAWDAVRACGGTDYLFKTETLRGFDAAQIHMNRTLSSTDLQPASDALIRKMEGLAPDKDLVFLVRAGGFAPGIYRCSALLDNLHGHTSVPTVLFYPGSAKAGTDLQFYDLPSQDKMGVYNYRVKIYGVTS